MCIVVSSICNMANAQLNKEAMRAYIDDVKAYERAIDKIVKERKYEDGISLLTELIERSEKTVNYPAKELASYYNARGQGWLHLKQYQQAENDDRQALALLKKIGESGKSDLTAVWYQLALVYYNWAKPDETMLAADNCVKAALDYYGPLHTETMGAYSLRSNVAGFYNRKEIALDDRRQIFTIIQQNVERNFVYLTASERTAYWNKYLPETSLMFAFAHKMNERESTFTDALFDQQLLAKGLLLTAESSLQRAIDGDESLRDTYQQIRELRRKAANGKTLLKDAEAATLEADQLERQLGTSASTIHQFLDFLKVHVGDVSRKLTADDVAIEFVDYCIGKDSTMYAALVLSPRLQHVRFIPLLESKVLSAHANNLAPYIWQPIVDALGYRPHDIYFAPSGLLYQYPIESQKLDDGRLMCEAYRMHRLSSTRWIAYAGDDIKGQDAVVYGGLTYDSDTGNTSTSTPSKTRGAMEDLPYLAGTKTEAEAIVRTINSGRRGHLHAEALLGTHGTASSFKSYSGRHKAVIHIATHGFYQPSRQATSMPDDALQHSGLYFSGSEVLTATDIATIDLRGLELIALSACQTGQGYISPDGVFGLQRGFKKAGAKSILMSLWKVDDEATCLLMTEFYKNWITNGKSKHEALEQAKQIVRSHKEKGWDDPKYWASFILLDAF